MHIVLVEPEIPQNTGNISRTCVMTDSDLHLIKPLGFSLDDRYLKRAGLDYWNHLRIHIHENWHEFFTEYGSGRFFYFSVKGSRLYHKVSYRFDDFLVFGSETSGLASGFLNDKSAVVRLPMNARLKRSLNLSNTVAVVVYEAMRQQDFPGMI